MLCADCGQEKPHEAKGLCRPCYGHRWQEAHPDYDRRYCEEHREERATYKHYWHQEHREKLIARACRWQQENPEKVAIHSRQYYAENRDEVLTRQRRWRKENPEKKVGQEARRRARKRALPNTLTAKEINYLLAIGQAIYPGEELHLDHIVPLSKGGGTTLANMHAIPVKINYFKGDRLPEEVYSQLRIF